MDIEQVFSDITVTDDRLVSSVRRTCAGLGAGRQEAEPLRETAVRLALAIRAAGPSVDPPKLAALSRELRATIRELAEGGGDPDDPYNLGDMSATLGDEADEG